MIGVGIITCDRIDFFTECFTSLPDYIDHLVIVNDGKIFSEEIEELIKKRNKIKNVKVIQNESNQQVGHCKNQAMVDMLEVGCDYIFTMEDDIKIKDPDVFINYINASHSTGIQHMNFGFSQKENLDKDLKPVWKKTVEYPDGTKIILTPNILGAFTFYTRRALQSIGLHHYRFNKGHGDHPELTYRAFKHGFTTPFWWFADIYESWLMIENQSNMGSDSLVRNQTKFMENFKEACWVFKELHGHGMIETPLATEEEVIKIMKRIKKGND